MTYFRAVAGALAIMMASGMIADYDVSINDDRVDVRIWVPEDKNDAKLRRQVTALLSSHTHDARVSVVGEARR